MKDFTKKEIVTKLQNIFRYVFNNDDLVITLDTVAEDIEEWDSLSHVQLISNIEKVFSIKLLSREILSWDNIDELVNLIQSKLP